MFSLVRFLRIQPHTNYFCKNCPCSSMDYRINAGGRECELCGHSPLRHYNWCVADARPGTLLLSVVLTSATDIVGALPDTHHPAG